MYAANSSTSGLWNDVAITSRQRFLWKLRIYMFGTGDTTTTAELTIANANLNTSSIVWMERLVDEGEELLKKRIFQNSSKSITNLDFIIIN